MESSILVAKPCTSKIFDVLIYRFTSIHISLNTNNKVKNYAVQKFIYIGELYYSKIIRLMITNVPL